MAFCIWEYGKRKCKNLRNKILDRLFPQSRPCRLDLRRDLRGFDIGDWSWGHLRVSNRGQCSLKIGKFCSFAYNCHVLLGGEHRKEWITTYRFPAYAPFDQHVKKFLPESTITLGDVTIGNDVWVGHDVIIMSGVRIGDGAIIGAGSVVRKSVPPYGIASGNPARVHGYRFERAVIERLLRIAWWDWPTDRLMEALPDLLSGDVEAFINKYGDEETPFRLSEAAGSVMNPPDVGEDSAAGE